MERMKTNTAKKILCLALCAIMLIAMLPVMTVPAYAEEEHYITYWIGNESYGPFLLTTQGSEKQGHYYQLRHPAEFAPGMEDATGAWNTASDGSGMSFDFVETIWLDGRYRASEEVIALFNNDVTLYLVGADEGESTLVSKFNAVLLLDENASVPNATINYSIAPGTGIAAVPGTSMAVLTPSADTGVTGTPTISNAVFTSASTTVTSVEGVTIDAGEKAAVTPVTIDFSNVSFAQPGIFRYVISEPSSGNNMTYDTQLNDTTNGTRYQRVLDVYVVRDANDDYVIGGYVLHEVAGTVAEGATTAADKSAGFVNEYDTLSLTVEADAAGNQSSAEKYFAYTVTITNPSGTEFTVSADWSGGSTSPVPGVASSYTAAEMASANTEEWTSTSAGVLTHTFYLKEGQEVEINGIPAGATYSVTSVPEDYSPSWEIGALSGETAGTGNQTLNANTLVSFLMTREGVVPTGVALSILPGVIIMIGGLATLIVMKNRKKEEGADA